jgi:NTF2 fold immunity protein of polymorphic toxin system component
MRVSLTISLIFMIAALTAGQSYKPKEGYVPDSATAVKIAEAVLVPVYGKKQIESEQPFTAKLETDIWTVSGTLHCPDGKGGITTHCEGGVAVVKISRIDAHIVSMIHYK